MFPGSRDNTDKTSQGNNHSRILLKSSPGSIVKPRTSNNRTPIGVVNSAYNSTSFANQIGTSSLNSTPRVDFEALILQRLNENNRLIQALFEKVDHLEEKVDTILNRLSENDIINQEQQDPLILDNNDNESYEFAERVKRELNLDVNMNLFYNSYDLLGVPFSFSNINSYGTKLMDILFTRDELATHTIDPMRSEMPSLDADKINMIKVCYLKKFGCIETFRNSWPVIRSSLKQKCLDTKRRRKRKEEGLKETNIQNDRQESPPEVEYDLEDEGSSFYHLVD